MDGSRESFKESIQTLTKFALFSRLKLNNDKTQVVWIGSKKNSNVRFLRDKNFCWDPGIFQVLEIKFCSDATQISSINFERKINEIIMILNNWSRRQITSLREIAVVKTLVLPKLIHLYVSLLDPSGDFLKEHDKMLLLLFSISVGWETE